MKNIVGPPARAENFFPRKKEMRKIEKALNARENLQIVAPRRIGKTSLLYYYYDNPPENSYVVFVDTESVDSVNNYYRKLFEKILEHEEISREPSLVRQIKNVGNKFLRKVKSINIAGNGMEFREEQETDYFRELTNFIKGIDLNDYRIILMVDEFPETILNIIEKNNDDTDEANELLRSNRELRMDPVINTKLQMIYTGSISLNLTVNKFGSSKYIIDLKPVSVSPLDYDEAVFLIQNVLNDEGYKIESGPINYLIKRMQWCIISQVQMVIEEITSMINPDKEITAEIVEMAFLNLLNHEHNNYFNHYVNRLNRVYGKEKLDFVKEILHHCATDEFVSKNKTRDLAVKHNMERHYSQILEGLEYDGYINNDAENDCYVFNSPILRMWWQKHICHE